MLVLSSNMADSQLFEGWAGAITNLFFLLFNLIHKIMKQKFGPKGQTLLRNLIAGLNEAKKKWQARYNDAVSEFDKYTIIQHINRCSEDIAWYSRILKEGVRV